MNSQQDHWNKKHTAGHISKFSEGPNPLAVEVSKLLTTAAKILEVGCGSGKDAKYFADQGFNITATDFSSVVITENNEKYKDISNLKFEVLNILELNLLESSDFDVVYARLSLHYFTNVEIKIIFTAIANKLNRNGILVFLCKSTKDPLYDQGELIEKDMYSLNGHVRHFFSEKYAKECLKDKFEIKTLESSDEFFSGDKSSFIKVICTKKRVQLLSNHSKNIHVLNYFVKKYTWLPNPII